MHMWALIGIVLLAGVPSCTPITRYTDPVVLRHAETGKTVKCGPYLYVPSMRKNRYGQTRTVALRRAKKQCIEAFQRQGYVPVLE